MLLRDNDNHFQQKQKSPCTRMDANGAYVKIQWVVARENDYLIF